MGGKMQRYAAPMDVVCGCPRNKLCDACVTRQLSWFTGVAAVRGERWAESVAERRPQLLVQPWPALEGRAAVIAASKIAELSDDLRVLEQLLAELDAAARKRWEGLRGGRGSG